MAAFLILWQGILSCILVYVLYLISLGKKSTKWASTTGKLLEFEVIKARFISLKLKYEYEVNGKKYVGRRMSFLNPIFDSERAIESDKFFNRIMKDELQVYYSEKYPSISTLQTGVKGWSNAALIIVLYVIGIYVIASRFV